MEGVEEILLLSLLLFSCRRCWMWSVFRKLANSKRTDNTDTDKRARGRREKGAHIHQAIRGVWLMARLQHVVVLLVMFLLFLHAPVADAKSKETGEEGEVDADADAEETISVDFTPGPNMVIQKKAVKAWAKQLIPEVDYNATEWIKRFNAQPQNFFEHYIRVLSSIFLDNGAIVNFALVGACDGTNDRTIRESYVPNEHWHGVFVEPFTINFNDLSSFMEKAGVIKRTHLIHAAATSKCNSTTIKMKRPNYEEMDPTKPHWMRRQIGAVVPGDKLDRPMTGGWVAEYVRCVTGDDILRDWAAEVNRKSKGSRKATGARPITKMRPHILKVDVEGHDFDVLSSFFTDDVSNAELPLLINFEAKSIGAYWQQLKDILENRGYIVSHFANDGFALLKGDRLSKNKKDKKDKKDKKGKKKKGKKQKKQEQ